MGGAQRPFGAHVLRDGDEGRAQRFGAILARDFEHHAHEEAAGQPVVELLGIDDVATLSGSHAAWPRERPGLPPAAPPSSRSGVPLRRGRSNDPASTLDRAIAVRALRLGAVGTEMDDLWQTASELLRIDQRTEARTEDPNERAKLRAELDVLVARDLFQLSKDEFRFLIDPVDMIADAEFEFFGALKRSDIRDFGDFRTKELILREWDLLTLGGVSSSQLPTVSISAYPSQTKVDPASLPDGAWIGPADAASEAGSTL
eukprot:gene32229-43032_t